MKPQIFVTEKDATVCEQQFQPVVNDPDDYRQKPRHGGLWTSTWREKTQDSAWVAWCQDNSFGDVEQMAWWLLTPAKDIRVYTIASVAGLERCLQEYGRPHLLAQRVSVFTQFAKKRVLDFERLAQDYDCLHLTARGASETHLSLPNDMNSWDCESTLWFRWCFVDVHCMTKDRTTIV